GVAGLGGLADAPALHGLKIVAVAVVANAVWGMARSLAPDRPRATVAIGAAAGRLLPGSTGAAAPGVPLAVRLPRGLAAAAAILFVALLGGLPLAAAA